jgi:hypothetical protein
MRGYLYENGKTINEKDGLQDQGGQNNWEKIPQMEP